MRGDPGALIGERHETVFGYARAARVGGLRSAAPGHHQPAGATGSRCPARADPPGACTAGILGMGTGRSQSTALNRRPFAPLDIPNRAEPLNRRAISYSPADSKALVVQ